MAMEFRIGKRIPDRFGIVNGDQIHKQTDLSKDMRGMGGKACQDKTCRIISKAV